MHHLLSRLCLTLVAVAGYWVSTLLLHEFLTINKLTVPEVQGAAVVIWSVICLVLGLIFLKDMPRRNHATRLLQYTLLALTAGLPLLDPYLIGLKASTLEAPALLAGGVFIASLWLLPLKALLMWRPSRKPKAVKATVPTAPPLLAEPILPTPVAAPLVRALPAPASLPRPEDVRRTLVEGFTLLIVASRQSGAARLPEPFSALLEAQEAANRIAPLDKPVARLRAVG